MALKITQPLRFIAGNRVGGIGHDHPAMDLQ
jgi:hypothetical protein